ncbi:MAG: glycosyltransferase family 1 protein [Patescibacteria group bacterium]
MNARIAVNGLFLTRPHTGMGRYTLGLLRSLPAAMRGAEFVAFVPEKVAVDLPRAIRTVVVPPKRSLLGRGKALDDWERSRLGVAAGQCKAHLIFQPYPAPPTRNPFDVPVVMAVHDVIPWQLPRYRRAIRSRVKFRGIKRGIRAADHLLTVSSASAKAISWAVDVPRQQIAVTYEGLEPEYRTVPSSRTVTAVRKRYGLVRPYVFYVGGYDYRKNIRGLVRGFAESGLPAGHDLVLAGALTAPSSALYEDFHRLPILIAQSKVNGQVRTIGFVSESEKQALLSGADAFCYPSLAEGFGLPVLEALAGGTPVAASDIEPIHELFAGAYEPFRPDHTEELATALRKAVLEPDERKVEKGHDWAKHYTWETAAERTAAVFSEQIKRHAARRPRR